MAAKSSVSEVRAWAKQQGFTLADRGRLPAEVWAAWESRGNSQFPKRTLPRTTPAQARSDSTEDLAAATARIEQLEQQVAALVNDLAALRNAPAEQPRRRFTRPRKAERPSG